MTHLADNMLANKISENVSILGTAVSKERDLLRRRNRLPTMPIQGALVDILSGNFSSLPQNLHRIIEHCSNQILSSIIPA